MVFTPVGDALQDKMGKNKSLKDQLETAHIIAATEKVFSEHFSDEVLARNSENLFFPLI